LDAKHAKMVQNENKGAIGPYTYVCLTGMWHLKLPRHLYWLTETLHAQLRKQKQS